MENRMCVDRQPPRFPVFPLFCHRQNAHFYDATRHSDCHCVIDGSSLCHELWRLEPHWKLSNEAQFAVVVENFFRSLLRANITPHVIFMNPSKDIDLLARGQRLTAITRILLLDSSEWRETNSIQSRVIFGEVIKALGIHHFFSMNEYDIIASYAKSVDAFILSGNNFFFFADVPRGYLRYSHLPLKQLPYGLIEIVGLTYFREKFLKSFRCVEEDKMKAIALFTALVSPMTAKSLEEFRRARILKRGARIDGINTPSDYQHEYLAQCLLFVSNNSFEDARLRILSHMYPNKRQVFEFVYETSYAAFTVDASATQDHGNIVPKLRGYLEVLRREHRIQASESADDKECSGVGSDDGEGSEGESDDDSATAEILPDWFKKTVQSEAHCGYFGNKLQSMVTLLATGRFDPLHHLQDPLEFSACFASLRLRRVLYGIMFQDLRRQLQGEEAFDAFRAFRIDELAGIRKRLCNLRVEPTWSVTDSAVPQEILELPGLHGMKDLDLGTRKRIFAVAMAGSSTWLDNLGPDARKHEYNILLLRSWAKRSPGLKKIHVTVLLLTILAIEARYSKDTRFFPSAISFREGTILQCPPQTAVIRYKSLQAFAQLQSVTDIASYLNSALASPHGHLVESVREFYSEVFFHNLLTDWNPLTEAEQTERLGTLFENHCLEKFLHLANVLYGDDDEPERAPLYLVRSAKGLPSDEILGKVDRIRCHRSVDR